MCWTFQAQEEGLLVTGHALDLSTVVQDERNEIVIIDMIQREGVVGVTIRTSKEAVCFLPNMMCVHALIDQSDPLLQKIDPATERVCRFSVDGGKLSLSPE